MSNDRNPGSRTGRAPEPGLAVRALRPLVDGLRSRGHDPAPLLVSAGLDTRAWVDPDAREPMSRVMAFWRAAVEATADPDLGLHLAESASLSSFDITPYIFQSSPTLGAAYQRLARYQRLVHDTTRVLLEVEGNRARLRHMLPGGLPVPRHPAEFLLVAWVRAGRVATGREWAPLEARFAHVEPGDVGEHGRFFRCPVRFATGENALVLPAALLDAPCVGADPGLLAILERHARGLLERLPRSNSLADRTRAVLLAELGGGEPTVARLASRLKMSVRTLQRGLAAEEASFARLLEQVRRELATRHLADRDLSIAEVAYLCGFSELSAFYRAFKRWTGTTPAEYRRRAVE